MKALLKIVGKPVETDMELEIVRLIRNSGRQWMTENTNAISSTEQKKWWANRSDDLKMFVYWLKSSDQQKMHVGYGLLSRRDDSKLYVSLAVMEPMRGKGIGVQIYSDLVERVNEPVYAVILKNNIASIKAAEKAAFKFQEDGDKTLLYVRSK